MIEEIKTKTWKRLDLNLASYGYSENVFFIILDHEYNGSVAPDDDDSILYSGFSPDGNLFAINEILSQKVVLYNLHQPSWTGWSDYKSIFYIYWTTEDWSEYSTASEWNDYQCIGVNMEYDWTYDNNIIYKPIPSDFTTDIIDYRQFLLWTSKQIEEGVDSRTEVLVDGIQLYSTPILEDEFCHTYNIYLPTEIPYEGIDKEITLVLRPIDGGDEITKKMIMTSTCYRYVLYYLNKLGGWSWIFINGKELQTDNMSRLSYKRNYFPQYSVDMNNVNYLNTISENWEFTTGWLEQSQSKYIIDLLQSNKVYLQDLNANNDEQIPVMIKNSSVDYKTYKNQGRKLYSYTINVEASQPKYILDSYKLPELY